jgi:hypothetical protein
VSLAWDPQPVSHLPGDFPPDTDAGAHPASFGASVSEQICFFLLELGEAEADPRGRQVADNHTWETSRQARNSHCD